MSMDDPTLDQSRFSHFRERLMVSDCARRFFYAVVREARDRGATLGQTLHRRRYADRCMASMKSFKRKDGPPSDKGSDDGMVDFKSEKRSNATHASTTYPDAKLMCTGAGKESKLSYGGHALMKNRHGLCVDIRVTPAIEHEPRAAEAS